MIKLTSRQWGFAILGICGVLFVLMIIGAATSTDKPPAKPPAAAEKPIATPPPKPAPPPKPEPPAFTKSQIEKLVIVTVGECNREKVKRVQAISVVPMQGDLCEIQIDFAGDDSLSTNLMRKGMLNDMRKLAKGMWAAYPDRIGELAFVASFAMKDQYGKLSEDPVASITLNRSTL